MTNIRKGIYVCTQGIMNAGIFVKSDEGKKRQVCYLKNVKEKHNRDKRTETYLWKLDQISGKQKYRI